MLLQSHTGPSSLVMHIPPFWQGSSVSQMSVELTATFVPISAITRCKKISCIRDNEIWTDFLKIRTQVHAIFKAQINLGSNFRCLGLEKQGRFETYCIDSENYCKYV